MAWLSLLSGGFSILKQIWPVLLGVFLAWFIHSKCNNTDTRPPLFSNMNASVSSVDSGNSLEISIGKRRSKTVRLAMIGVAPLSDPNGQKARQLTQQLVDAGEVRLKLTDGRRFHHDVVAIVWNVDNRCINYELIAAGLAWTVDCKESDWLLAEKEAKKNKLGVWAEKAK